MPLTIPESEALNFDPIPTEDRRANTSESESRASLTTARRRPGTGS